MRKIKFRAWDLNEKVFASFLDINISSKNKVPTEFGFVEDGSLIFMQYTGLKDKNGKEIYEGDIVFDEYYKHNIDIVDIFEPDRWVEHKQNGNQVDNWEIVGNIYENPELLDY